MNFLLAQWIERNENNEENRCMKFPELRNMVDLNDEKKDLILFKVSFEIRTSSFSFSSVVTFACFSATSD